MFSLDFIFVCQFCVCLFASVFTCVHLLTHPRAVVWLLCVSLSVCECVHQCVCVRECACVRLRSFLHLMVFIRLLSCFSLPSLLPPSPPSFPPSIPRCLPPHLAPSPLGVDTERPNVGAADTSPLWPLSAQTVGVTWLLFKYSDWLQVYIQVTWQRCGPRDLQSLLVI